MNPQQVPWFLQTQAQQMANAPQMFTANPQAKVNQPISLEEKAPVEPGPEPSATRAKSVARAPQGDAQPKASGLDAYLPVASSRSKDEEALLGIRDAQASAKRGQEAELAGLSDYINTLSEKKSNLDLSPLAAYIDYRNQGKSNFQGAAKEMAGMSPDERDQMIFGLKNTLMKGRAAMAKGELDSLKAETQMQQFREHQDELERSHRAMEGAAATRANSFGERNLTAKDAQAQRMADRFDTHPTIVSGVNRYNQIGLDKHTLETTQVITPQIMDELSQGIATALNGGRSAGLGMAEKQELSNIQKDYATLKQYTGQPMNALTPANRKMLIDLFDRLQDGYGNIIAAQAEKIAKGRDFAFNPVGNRTRDEKLAEYRGYRKQKSEGGGEVTVSNGKETLTIPASDLQHAQKEGFQVVK